MADTRASCLFAAAAWAGDSRAAASAEWPAAAAGAVADAADVADAPTDAIIVGRPTKLKAAESAASPGARLMRLHELFAEQANCLAGVTGAAAVGMQQQVGFSMGSQWVLSGYSVSTQGAHGYSDCAFLSTQGVLR